MQRNWMTRKVVEYSSSGSQGLSRLVQAKILTMSHWLLLFFFFMSMMMVVGRRLSLHRIRLARVILSYLRGHLLLLRFYTSSLFLLWRLPAWMTNPAQLEHHLKGLREGTTIPVTLKCSSSPADTYNKSMKALGADLRKLHEHGIHSRVDYSQSIILVRLAMVVFAWYGSTSLMLLVGLLQFYVAPYSLWIAFSQGLNILQFVHIPHYLSFSGLHLLSSHLLPYIPGFLVDCGQLPVNSTTIAIFFLADQSYIIYLEGLRHSPMKALHGFLNNKTMPLVVLLLCSHHLPTFSLWLWLLEGALLKLTPRLSTLLNSASIHYNALFYHHHRIAHAPYVYEQGHKIHHGINQGTTAFEASFFGCGIGEEYFLLAAEVFFLQSFGLPPASLNWFVVFVQGNKNKHGHTETENRGYSYHTDHHKLHMKNFGSFNHILDCYFSTAGIGYKSYNLMPGGLTKNVYNSEDSDKVEIRLSCSRGSDGVTSFHFTDAETEHLEPSVESILDLKCYSLDSQMETKTERGQER